MQPYHIDPSNEALLPGVQPPRPLLMTFSAQRYEPRLRTPPAARNSLLQRNKQEDVDIETSSVWSQSTGRISLISSMAASVNTEGGRGFGWNSWVTQLDIMRRKVMRYSFIMKQRFVNRFSLVRRGISQLVRGRKMNMSK
ncbi:hypothetical protein Agabi119p4_3916 [Agaricus bisporus var. burnettii]|uniref:Uncharacterized protein n=1 Tax=Agaricus bisporus var. burnettii TaxID=192524 RepID=A0A8H7F5R7_AGABI|nr:hypothetical protein Agabi119p4_3916 [Agaricus bisporus var. burnettii]